MSSIFFSSPLTINQETSIYSYNAASSGYDYILEINTQSLTNSSDITTLFQTATFQQNAFNSNDVDISLSISPSLINPHINSQIVSIIQGASTVNFGSFSGGDEKRLGDRLVEIVAHKIFGHAQARAAINNDNDFYRYDDNLWNHLSDTVSTDSFARNLFNQYVALDRITNVDDVNTPVLFNFDGLTLDFPLYLSGRIILNNSLSQEERSILNNGPEVGGSGLDNGVYNIPILVKFKNA
jgi:hypothetical protein